MHHCREGGTAEGPKGRVCECAANNGFSCFPPTIVLNTILIAVKFIKGSWNYANRAAIVCKPAI